MAKSNVIPGKQQLISRLLQLPKKQNIFLFGARGTGKSTLIRETFGAKNAVIFDLLDLDLEERLARNPQELHAMVMALSENITHVVLDEVQKLPKLLNVVHGLIETTSRQFILTGSSARKLKHGGANLLAGRAFVYNLAPFSFLELGAKFNLVDALQWGALPKIYALNAEEDRLKFLQAYALTYLKEEVWGEQLVRKLDPFRKFIEVAAQCNGKIISYANIARDVGVDDKTIKDYFSILEDTLLGFFLEPFQHSFRKRLSLKPKFYFFDTGVVRALNRTLTLPLQSKTSAYGEAFEHLVILECVRLAGYFKSEYRFSYLRTKDDAEIDLVVERPGLPILFIEIKSSDCVTKENLSTFFQVTKEFQDEHSACEAICFSCDPRAKRYGHVTVMPWMSGVKKFFGKNKAK